MEWQTVVVGLGSAIFGALANSLIERKKAQRSRELQEMQNVFSVGANSHMAAVAFDKHIGFCEQYVKEMYKALDTSIQGGGEEEPLDPRRFSRIRQDWALWLTRDIESKLDQFELTIKQVIDGPARDVDADGAYMSNKRSITRNVVFLRGVLLTEDLTRLRKQLVMPPSGEH
jgi:hypothetical protein